MVVLPFLYVTLAAAAAVAVAPPPPISSFALCHDGMPLKAYAWWPWAARCDIGTGQFRQGPRSFQNFVCLTPLFLLWFPSGPPCWGCVAVGAPRAWIAGSARCEVVYCRCDLVLRGCAPPPSCLRVRISPPLDMPRCHHRNQAAACCTPYYCPKLFLMSFRRAGRGGADAAMARTVAVRCGRGHGCCGPARQSAREAT